MGQGSSKISVSFIKEIVEKCARLVTSLALLTVFLNVSAQKENSIWCFGDSIALNFNTEPASLLPHITSMSQNEGMSTISTPNGRLLFYTDGVSVWDSTNQKMPNGHGLKGGNSSTQSALIIRQPNSTTHFYIFTTSMMEDYGTPRYLGLAYSEVDMTLNSGKGDVIPATKNHLLLNPSTEKLTATLHANGRDIWVLGRELALNHFQAFLVTPTGVSIVPVISTAGKIYPFPPEDLMAGYLRFSPNGKKLANAVYNRFLEIYDFDFYSGIVSNTIIDSSVGVSPYGCEFSTNSMMLYVAYTVELDQYNVVSSSATDVLNSKFTVALPPNNYHTLQLGIDKKIYMSEAVDSVMHIIETPDSMGSSCNFVLNAMHLPRVNEIGLQNILCSYNFQPFILAYHNDSCALEASFRLSDTSWLRSVRWDFDDGQSTATLFPTHTYLHSGTYAVSAAITFASDSIRVLHKTLTIANCDTILPNPCFLFPDAFTPNGDGVNDEFKPLMRPECQVQEYTLQIFNSWGQLVFISSDITKGWNGYVNNTPQALGTYIYLAKYSLQGKEMKVQGALSLLR